MQRMTELVNIGQENVFAVKVDNSEGINLAPLAADFTFCGGIYRSVHLLVTNKVHISPLDYGSPGIYLRQSNVSETSADLSVITKAKNDSAEAREVTVCSVELFVNTTSLQSRASDSRIFIWNNVFLPDENNVIEAVGTCNGMTYRDSIY